MFASLRARVEEMPMTVKRDRIRLVVHVENHEEIWDFDKELALAAGLGDRIEVAGSGLVERIALDGWLQWKFVG